MSLQSVSLEKGWKLQSSVLAHEAGDAISTNGYDVNKWHAVRVPSTVLNALVEEGIYPDPRYGLNNFRIPDASDAFNKEHDLIRFSLLPGGRNPWLEPWWYRAEFNLPEDRERKQWLIFDGINYRADIWVNGKRIAAADEVAGAFRQYRFDVTGILRKGLNCLAIRIHGLDHPGVPIAQLEPFQEPRTNHRDIPDNSMKDVSFNICAVGYDCAPTVRDRLMGIWRPVRLEFTGPVDIRHPFVRTALPLPDTSSAAVTISVTLVNSEAKNVTGVLRGRIEQEVSFAYEVSLGPGEEREVVADEKLFPQLRIADPKLWWPVGYGAQDLYELQLTFEKDGVVSDAEDVRFGVREITKVLHEKDGEHGLRLTINGRRVFCFGGYLQADTLLAGAMMGRERWEAEVRYLASARLNTVSFEDLPVLPEALLDLCDQYGIMVWNCFFQCECLNREDHPLDHDLLEASAADIVRHCRNHPSVVCYMCMNEGTAMEDQYRRWRRQVIDLDGTRILIPTGYFNYSARDYIPEWVRQDTPVGVNDYPPKTYGWWPPEKFFRMVREDRKWMFKIESGSASVPPPESLAKFIPELGKDPADSQFPLNTMWAHHGANSYFAPYDEAVRRRYGHPDSVEDYWWKSVMLTANQHRAMFDAVNHRRWELTSGFMQWKLNTCWPSIQWQLYDYFLCPLVSYYYIKRACAPFYVLQDPIDSIVTVVNTKGTAHPGVIVSARCYDTRSCCLAQRERKLNVPSDCRMDAFAFLPPADATPVYFVHVEARDNDGSLLADNLYWRTTREEEDDRGCYADLCQMPVTALRASMRKLSDESVSIRIENPGDSIAPVIRLQVKDENTAEEILPAFWEDNYFWLLPGQSLCVEARYFPDVLKNKRLKLDLTGWRTKPLTRLLH